MFIAKLKNAVALVTVAVILTAGAGTGMWRYAAGAGQEEKQAEEKPIPAAPRPVLRGDAPKRPRVVPKDCQFQIALRIEREKNGKRELLGSPQLRVSGLNQQAFFGLADKYAGATPVGGGETDFVGMGPSVRVAVLAYFGDKICLDMTVNQPTKGSFGQGDTTVEAKSIRVIRKLTVGEPTTVKLKAGEKESSVLEVAVAVRTVEKKTDPNTIAAAEENLQFAGFSLRTGRPDCAKYYYELILRRYPDTPYAERANKGLSELRELVRVGQVWIIGNEKTSDTKILEQVPIFPGQVMTFPDLRIAAQIAEQNLSRLKGLKSNPKVKVVDGGGEYKDIEIKVEEK